MGTDSKAQKKSMKSALQAAKTLKLFNYPGFEHTKKHGLTLILAGTLKSTYLNTALNISLPTRNHKKGSILGLETAIFELPAMETTVADFSECDKVVYINIKIETLQTLLFDTFAENDRMHILRNHCVFPAALSSTIQPKIQNFLESYLDLATDGDSEKEPKANDPDDFASCLPCFDTVAHDDTLGASCFLSADTCASTLLTGTVENVETGKVFDIS